jgi:signal transduction histidine kinase
MDGTLPRWYRRLSLRARFTLLITLSLLALFAGLLPGVYYLERRAVLTGAWDRGLQLTKVFAHASVQGVVADDFLVVRHVINSVSSEPDVIYAMIVDPGGLILSHTDIRQSGDLASDPLAPAALAATEPLGQEVRDPDLRAYEFTVPVYVLTERRAVARVGVSLERELARLATTRHALLAVGAIALLGGCGVAAWQARSVTRPLGDLVKAARSIAAGNLAERIAPQESGEVGELGDAFNRMAAALEARVAELKGAQDELVRTTRLAAIGEIAAVMAHETRNPLGSVRNCVQTLRKHAQLSPENAELLDIIKGETDRLNAIVSDFLAYGRPRAPVFQRIDLHEAIDGALRLLRRDDRWGAGVAVSRALADPAPTVRADPDQLRQVLCNLFLNAAQAMGGKGTLHVETTADNGLVHVAVEDTGCGLAPDDVARAFEPFRSKRPGGIGLGLATVRRIVEDHGGRVALRSAPGEGTRVLVALPDAR